MSIIQPLPPPGAGTPIRADLPFAPGGGGARPAPATAVETARAPLPIEAAPLTRDTRFTDHEGRPVGPPPAFQTSLLKARRDAAMQPIPPRLPPAEDAAAGFAPPRPESAPDQVDRRV